MRRMITSAVALAATLLLPLAAHTPLAQSTVPAVVAGSTYARVIVKYRADSDLMNKQAMTAVGKRILQAQALGDRIGVVLTAGIGLSDRSHVVMARGLSSSSLAARIAAQKDVEYAVVDERKHIVAVPKDRFYGSRAYNDPVSPASGGPLVGQWYLKPPGLDGTLANTAPAAINAEQAWDLTTGSAGVVVAVLDTGVRFDHVDLKTVAAGGNLLPGYDMIEADDGPGGTNFSTANDNSGRDPDASDPGDFVSAADKANNPIFAKCTVEPNSSWHGTQTLGLIGAMTDNTDGIASVGRNVRVMPVRVLGKCGGNDSDIQAGILWAAGIHVPGVPDNANPAKVINMSLGGTGTCNSGYIDVIAQANAVGAVIVVSAGNSAGHFVGTPANCPGVIAVTGLRHVGDKVGFSDLGPEVAISAPGGNCVNITAGLPCLYPIMTTTNSGTTTPFAGAPGAIYTDSFNPSLGTSFSAPLVSGTVALMLSAKPSLTPAQVKATLQSSARPFPKTGGTLNPPTPQCFAPTATSADQIECYCVVGVCGAGMLDAHAAVLAAIGVQAGISVTTTTPTAGQPISIASSSVIGAGQSATYQWSIVSAGATGAAITGAANGATVTVSATAAGSFTISLTTVDNNGFRSTANSVITVVAAPPGVQAAITVTTAAPTAGQPVAIASSSVIGAGQSATYQWAIVSAGSTGVVISGASNASTVTVLPSAAGSFTISLTTTDNRSFVSSASSTVTVAAAPAASSSGGGGALNGGWLMLLLTAVLALAAVSRFELRRAARRSLSVPARASRKR